MNVRGRGSDTGTVIEIWSRWLDRGWHGVQVSEWVDLYLSAKLEADILFLDLLVKKSPDLARVAQRMRREAVGNLMRAQHLLPWSGKSRPQFFREQRDETCSNLREIEHAFPISQVKSLVLMALDQGDYEQARKRLVYCWLLPTVLCTRETHSGLPRRCENFDRPLDRYSGRYPKASTLKLLRYDQTIVDPETYSRAQLLEDIRFIKKLRPIVDQLDGLTFPTPDEEDQYIRSATKRGAGRPI